MMLDSHEVGHPSLCSDVKRETGISQCIGSPMYRHISHSFIRCAPPKHLTPVTCYYFPLCCFQHRTCRNFSLIRYDVSDSSSLLNKGSLVTRTLYSILCIGLNVMPRLGALVMGYGAPRRTPRILQKN